MDETLSCRIRKGWGKVGLNNWALNRGNQTKLNNTNKLNKTNMKSSDGYKIWAKS